MTSDSKTSTSNAAGENQEIRSRRIVRTRRALPKQEKIFGSKRAAESLPGLIEMPRKSYARFLGTDFTRTVPVPVDFDADEVSGLQELLDEMNPIQDAGQRVKFSITEPFFDDAERSEAECRANDLTYQRRLGAKAVLEFADGGGAEQPVWLGFVPMMTPHGTFLINGAERVVISQLVRSPGVYFSAEDEAASDQPLAAAKVIPNRGAWLEFETSIRNGIGVKVDRKKRVPVTVLLRAIDSEELLPFSSEDKARIRHYEENFERAQQRLDTAQQRNKELRGKSDKEDIGDLRADAQLEMSEAERALQEASSNFHNRLELTLGTDDRIQRLLGELDSGSATNYLDLTLSKDSSTDQYSGLVDFYKVMRPGDPPAVDTAKVQIEAMFFDRRGYDLGRVGRHKLNERLRIERSSTNQRELTRFDILAIIELVWKLNHGDGYVDDIDNLANRRVRPVGELVANQFRIGLRRMERVVRDRLMIADTEKLQEMSPVQFVNSRPVEAAMKEFFGGAQLSQFMDQVNPLSEIAHKRKLSALGPGGLSRDRAKFDVRDVHYSHYGRICPIETPEGPNIGLIGALAMYGEINDFGFIQSPYYRVVTSIAKGQRRNLTNRILAADVVNGAGKVIGKKEAFIDADLAKSLSDAKDSTISVRPFVSLEREIFTAEKERDKRIAEARTNIDEWGNIVDDRVSVRFGGEHETVNPEEVDYIDVSAQQIVSIAAAMIPFLDHDLTHRALMGANMQRQAVPLIRPEAPLVGTGIEKEAAADSAQVICATENGEVISATADFLEVRYDSGESERFPLLKFVRSNQGTCINQRTRVLAGERFEKGQALVDSSSTDDGKLALGQSVLVAIMPWDGYNYEDAVVLSESVVREDKFTSIHIEKHEVEARDTKIGPEEITRDIPNVSEMALSHLDDQGVVRVGAEVREGDILVGKITPKGETELTPEEKLLRAIFGEKAREVRDTSLRVPHGEAGKVIDVRVVERPKDEVKSSKRSRDESGFELQPEVNASVRVWIAQKRHITAGDKMAGRHGNKGVVSKIVPTEDMPFLTDGRAVEVVLNPLGMPSRLNLGQVLETHLGWAASTLGFRAISPVFDGASHEEIEDMLARAYLALEAGAVETTNSQIGGDLEIGERVDIDRLESYLQSAGFDSGEVLRGNETRAASRAALALWLEAFKDHEDISELDLSNIRKKEYEELEALATIVSERINVASPLWGKQTLFDGRTGETFDSPVTVGYMYMLKLIHLVDDKIHARSTGPYSLITQQPLGGKAQFGGQRFGEMEVWALEAYGAAHVLQEILTVKSDDTVGRVKTYEAIVKGDDSVEPGVPESFRVLMKELQALGIQVDILGSESPTDEEPNEEAEEAVSRLGINLSRREIGA